MLPIFVLVIAHWALILTGKAPRSMTYFTLIKRLNPGRSACLPKGTAVVGAKCSSITFDLFDCCDAGSCHPTIVVVPTIRFQVYLDLSSINT